MKTACSAVSGWPATTSSVSAIISSAAEATPGCQTQRRAGDIHGEIADPLQVGDGLQDRADRAEVSGDRLLQGQQPHTPGLDVQIETVGQIVPVDDLFGEVGVLTDQRFHRVIQHLLDEAAEAHNIVLERCQLLVERVPGIHAISVTQRG